MVDVTKRLKGKDGKGNDVGQVTVNIENDIIDSLRDMIDSLKKERKKNQDKKGKPSPPKPGSPPKNKNEDLIDLIAELKMIRSMQVRVNKRTEDYHKFYPGVEQIPDVSAIKDTEERGKIEQVQSEIKTLAEREADIKRITRDIATGKNKTRD